MPSAPSLWAIVLAAGEGRRLAGLTRALYGDARPKQFAALAGRKTLLQQTLDRVEVIVPPERTVVVVGADYWDLARSQTAGRRGLHILPQPRNLDTGPGVLFPMAWIFARDPEALVVVFPSDHHVPHPAPFIEAVGAAAVASDTPSRAVLIGVRATTPETGYGWILPGDEIDPRGIPGLCRVRSFVEKPPPTEAVLLHEMGGLWNTFVLIGRASTWWTLSRKWLPRHFEAFAHWVGTGGSAGDWVFLQDVYRTMPSVSFSRQVLENAVGLCVMGVEGSGWADWGTPGRVFRSLRGTSHLKDLFARIRAARRPDSWIVKESAALSG